MSVGGIKNNNVARRSNADGPSRTNKPGDAKPTGGGTKPNGEYGPVGYHADTYQDGPKGPNSKKPKPPLPEKDGKSDPVPHSTAGGPMTRL